MSETAPAGERRGRSGAKGTDALAPRKDTKETEAREPGRKLMRAVLPTLPTLSDYAAWECFIRYVTADGLIYASAETMVFGPKDPETGIRDATKSTPMSVRTFRRAVRRLHDAGLLVWVNFEGKANVYAPLPQLDREGVARVRGQQVRFVVRDGTLTTRDTLSTVTVCEDYATAVCVDTLSPQGGHAVTAGVTRWPGRGDTVSPNPDEDLGDDPPSPPSSGKGDPPAPSEPKLDEGDLKTAPAASDEPKADRTNPYVAQSRDPGRGRGDTVSTHTALLQADRLTPTQDEIREALQDAPPEIVFEVDDRWRGPMHGAGFRVVGQRTDQRLVAWPPWWRYGERNRAEAVARA